MQQVQPSWSYSGEIRPDTEVQLAFKEPGYIAALYRVKGADGRMRDLQVGDEIPAGATLARLRSSDYQASLNSAVGQQRSAQGTLDASQAELNRAKADQAKADLDFERAQALYAAKAMTRPDYDAAVDQDTSATAGVEAAVRQIEARRGQLSAALGAGCLRADQSWRYEPERSHAWSHRRKECGTGQPGCCRDKGIHARRYARREGELRSPRQHALLSR